MCASPSRSSTNARQLCFHAIRRYICLHKLWKRERERRERERERGTHLRSLISDSLERINASTSSTPFDSSVFVSNLHSFAASGQSRHASYTAPNAPTPRGLSGKIVISSKGMNKLYKSTHDQMQTKKREKKQRRSNKPRWNGLLVVH